MLSELSLEVRLTTCDQIPVIADSNDLHDLVGHIREGGDNGRLKFNG